jgi:membrane protein YqaA with SNARE-associated domain
MAAALGEPFSYLSLFAICYIAATLFPLGSEVMVVWMVTQDYNNGLVLVVASAGNFLGSLTNYFVGKWGSDFLLSRWIRMDPATLQRAQDLYGRWGAPSLFFNWLPIIGDPLTLVSGIFKLRLSLFSFWVSLGTVLRYLTVIWLTQWVW